MSPAVLLPTVGTYLTWNSARLIALILNALTGVLIHYEKQSSTLTPDSIFGLKLIEGQLDRIYINSINNGYNNDIFVNIKNLSIKSTELSMKIREKFDEKYDSNDDGDSNDYYKKLENLFRSDGFRMKLSLPKKIDERYRWSDKQHFIEKSSRTWFDNKNNEDEQIKCIIDLISSKNKCFISEECQEVMLMKKGFNGYQLTTQIFYIIIGQNYNCLNTINETLLLLKNVTIDIHITEYCSNIISELDLYKKDKKKIARIEYKSLDLMLEQVFVCSSHGFIDFLDIHYITAALSWQNPYLGCWTRHKPEPIPNMGLSGDIHSKKFNEKIHTNPDEECVPHLTTVAIGSLISFLRFLLNPPSSEYHSSLGQLISSDTIVAEDQFRTFQYIKWVKDFPGGSVEFPKPPPIAWAPDLIAFVFLLLIILIGFIIAHNFCANHPNNRFGKRKRLYPFAYKKL